MSDIRRYITLIEASMTEAKKTLLFHGGLKANIPDIMANGLQPRIGQFTRGMYGASPDLVPAVFATTQKGLARAVHAMVAAINRCATEDDYREFRVGADYQISNSLFFKYAALFVLEKTDGFARTGKPFPDRPEPLQAEPGDYTIPWTPSPPSGSWLMPN